VQIAVDFDSFLEPTVSRISRAQCEMFRRDPSESLLFTSIRAFVLVLVLERSLGYEVDNVDKYLGVCVGEAVGPCREVAIQNNPGLGQA
jgi:hypothetical protein